MKGTFGKHEQYGDSDTDLPQGKEYSESTSHFTLRESAIEATLQKNYPQSKKCGQEI